MTLNSQNIYPYFLKHLAAKADFKVKKLLKVEEIIKHSKTNYIFKLKLETNQGKKTVFIKWAGQNKLDKKRGVINKQDSQRIVGEYRLIKLLTDCWGKKHVPTIYFFDKKNHTLAISDISTGKKLLAEEYATDKIPVKLGDLFGKMFGRLHSQTWGIKSEIAGSSLWKKQLISFYNFHYCFGIRKFVTESKVNKFLADSDKCPQTVTWGDPISRNIYVNQASFSAIDFDQAANYDPAFDLGLFLSQPFILMLKNKNLERKCQLFIKDFLNAYLKELSKNNLITPRDSDWLLERAVNWLAVYSLSRTDGHGDSYYQDNPKLEKRIRDVSLKSFNNKEYFFKVLNWRLPINLEKTEKSTTIYLARHSQAECNDKRQLGLISQSKLTKEGEKQAKILSQKLKNIKFDYIFSSNLLRAAQTAKIIAADQKLKVIIKKELRERSYGKFNSRTESQINKVLGKKFEAYRKMLPEKKFKYRLTSDMETEQESLNRFKKILNQLVVLCPQKIILIITHNTLIRNFLIDIGVAKFNNINKYPINTANYIIIKNKDKKYYLENGCKINLKK